jgi:formylglycine-generating enzyme required for sulfatase activity
MCLSPKGIVMPEPSACPNTQHLEQFLAGKLNEGEQKALELHIEGCTSCQRSLEALLPTNRSWVEVLGKPNARAGDPSEVTQAGPTAAALEEDLLFLTPSSKPHHLGRLGHYEVMELLGKGGFGTVLRAFDEKLHRVVAIKVLSPELSASGTARKRFTREAQAAAAVAHEHVVTIHAVEDEANPPYLVMQCIEGQSLQDKLDKEGPLGLKEILRIGLQAAEGLAAAHKQGLVHRDIKPANILLENSVERVKITDFGLARAVDDASLTQSGVVAGTPLYMSPEQAEGQNIDHRSDLFSLGTVLYVMCTGRPPFRATGTIAVLKRVVEETPRPIREINPDIPEWLSDIIAKLHAKKPAERYQTAKEVAEVLNEKLAALQMHGRASKVAEATASPVAAAPPKRPSRRVAVLVGGLMLLSLAAVTAFFFWPPGPLDKKTPVVPDPERTTANIAPPPADIPFNAAAAKAHQDAWARHLGVDAEITNAIGMKLRLIPPGKFLMGYSREQIDKVLPQMENETLKARVRDNTARPAQVSEAFYLAVHEVTVEQFRRFVKENDYRTTAERNGKGGVSYDTMQKSLVHKPEYIWSYRWLRETEQHPVVFVTLEDADAFCAWLSKLDGRKYAVPNETQWEYACRAGTTTLWWTGDSEEDLRISEWFRPVPNKVGSLAANPFGLYDMHGNVTEWVQSADSFGRRGGYAGQRLHWTHSAYRYHNDFNLDLGAFRTTGFRVAIVGDLQAKSASRQPFVLLSRDARAEQTFLTLKDAIDKAQSGDTIEIRGDGPFVGESIDLNKKALIIRAGLGYRPVLRRECKQGDKAWLSSNSSLVLEGLEFQSSKTDNPWQYIVASSNHGVLRIAHCRLLDDGKTSVIQGNSSLVEIVNSQIAGTASACIDRNLVNPGRLLMDNALLTSRSGSILQLEQRGEVSRQTLVLRNTTLVSNRNGYYLRFWRPRELEQLAPDEPPVRLDASGVVLAASVQSFGVEWRKDTEASNEKTRLLLRRFFRWSDEDNLYSAPPRFCGFFIILDEGGNEPPPLFARLTDWQQFWSTGKTKSIVGNPIFQGGDLLAQLKDDSPPLQPTEFRLRQDSPGKGKEGGKDLGADVDKVGPGKPYEDWKKTPEYDRWKNEVEALLAGAEGAAAPPLAVAPFNDVAAKAHQVAWANHLRVDFEFTNSAGMKMRLIPPGTFTMGSSAAEVETYLKNVPANAEPWVRSETPQRKVAIDKPYYLATCETTIGQFKQFVEEMRYTTEDEASGRGGTSGNGTRSPGFTWRHPEVNLSDQHPVSQITLHDAEEFCRWLSKKEGRQYVIPTEEKWEFACRAGTTTPWFCPKEALSLYAWAGPATPHPVGEKRANPFGLFDMHGNVEELTRGEKGYVARSGAGPAERIRSAYRVPQQRTESYRSHGFRVAIVGDLKSRPTPPAPKEEWVRLFNGKDLTGWKRNPTQPGEWGVEQGVLIGGGPTDSYLYTQRDDFENFHLLAECQINEGGNSGVYFRTPFGQAKGYEAQINVSHHDPIKTGSIHPHGAGLWAFQDMLVVKEAPHRIDEWFTLEVIARGPLLRILVNGKKTVEWEDPQYRLKRGHIALQHFGAGTVVRFRKIEIKELPPTPPTDKGEWTRLFNGKDLTGWKTNQPDNWKIENECIVGTGRGTLILQQAFQDFHFRLEAKVNPLGFGNVWFRSKGPGAWVALSNSPTLKTGSLYFKGVGEKTSKNLIKSSIDPTAPHRWFSVDIIARGTSVEVKIDGKTTAKTSIENLPEIGHFMLASDTANGSIYVRNIEIRELPPGSGR